MKNFIFALCLLQSFWVHAEEMTPEKFKALKSSLSDLKEIAGQTDKPINIKGLKSPESVLQTKEGMTYISEIGEFGKDGDGQISKVNSKGIVSVFAKGLDDPKGLAMMGDNLYVADKTRIMQIDPLGRVSLYIEAQAFPSKPQFLNDLESDNFGNLYVSDSGDLKKGGAIYKITKDKKVMTIVDSSRPEVLAPNGLLYEGRNTLLEVDFESGILYRINLATSQMIKIADGFGGGDGIAKTKTGKIFISDWKNGIVNQVSANRARMVSQGHESSADIALSNDGQYLLVPLMKPGELIYLPVHK